jgi:hypothetical protein
LEADGGGVQATGDHEGIVVLKVLHAVEVLEEIGHVVDRTRYLVEGMRMSLDGSEVSRHLLGLTQAQDQMATLPQTMLWLVNWSVETKHHCKLLPRWMSD